MSPEFNLFGPSTMDPETFTNPMLKVNWNLGNICTYKCSYCATGCHDASHPWPDIQTAVKTVYAIDQIYRQKPYSKQKIVFELLGGEVTIWKDIEILLDAIKATGNLSMLVTNGVRTLRWWKENAKNFGYVNLSFHPEYADYRHFLAVSDILVEAGVGASILCLMYPPKWDYCLEAHTHFVKHSQVGISVQTLTLLKDSVAAHKLDAAKEHNERWPYTEEQREWLKCNAHHARPREVKDRKWLMGNMIFMDKNNPSETQMVSNSYLSTNQLNNWKGWNCYVGIDTLYLEQNGDVRRDAMCRVRPPIGNWKNDDLFQLEWPTEPVKCPYSNCFCSHDFKARKMRPL